MIKIDNKNDKEETARDNELDNHDDTKGRE